MDYNTSELCDLFADSVDVVDPMFVSYGGRYSFGGEITTIKCFEDRGLIDRVLAQPGAGKVLLIDGGGSIDQGEQLIEMLLSADVGAIQLRVKGMGDAELVTRARMLVEKTRGSKTLSIINDRPDIAVLSGADGVHVGQDDLSAKDARQILGPHRLVGVSTHNYEQLNKAVLDGANYVGIGPIFESRTKQFSSFGGLSLLEQVANQTALPIFAIGGIDLQNIDAVIEAGVTRVAVASAITAAADPEAVIATLHQRLDQAASQAESV